MKKKMKEFIEKHQISAKNYAVVTKWGGVRYQYKIKVADKEFDYYDSIHNYKKGVKKLDDTALLFAFRCIIQDALSYIQYEDNIQDFALDFGYIEKPMLPHFDWFLSYRVTKNEMLEYISDVDFENFQNVKKAYSGCEDTYTKLCCIDTFGNKRNRHTTLEAILENLSEMEIE